jgi:hypothetical protein
LQNNLRENGLGTRRRGIDNRERLSGALGGVAMKGVTVYRVDRETKTKVPVGTVMERRKKERGRNLVGLLHLARKDFVFSQGDALQIQADNLRIEF